MTRHTIYSLPFRSHPDGRHLRASGPSWAEAQHVLDLTERRVIDDRYLLVHIDWEADGAICIITRHYLPRSVAICDFWPEEADQSALPPRCVRLPAGAGPS